MAVLNIGDHEDPWKKQEYVHTTTTALYYLKDKPEYKVEKPFVFNMPMGGIPGAKQMNLEYERRDSVVLIDIRGREEQFKIDQYGFELVKHDTSFTYEDFDDELAIRSIYYQEIEELVKKKLGACKAKVFDHTRRMRMPEVKGCGTPSARKPLLSVHIDQTPESSFARLKMFLPNEAASLQGKRFQVINVWRPLFGPLQDSPLALCDYRTINPNRDLVGTDLIFPHYIGENYNLNYNPDHKFYFVDKQKVNEVWMFKNEDTIKDPSIAKMAPHTSFTYSETPPDSRPRESIETRVLVLYEN